MNSNCNQCGNPCQSCGDVYPSLCPSCDNAPYTSINCGHPTDDKCINYTGDDNTCLNITKPLSIKDIFSKIILYLKNQWNTLTSNSLVITRSGGTCNSTATIEIVPSSDPNNSFKLGQDGKPFTPTFVVAGGQCITFERTEVSGQIIYTPVIDMDCMATLLCPICASDPGSICPQPLNIQINSK